MREIKPITFSLMAIRKSIRKTTARPVRRIPDKRRQILDRIRRQEG